VSSDTEKLLKEKVQQLKIEATRREIQMKEMDQTIQAFQIQLDELIQKQQTDSTEKRPMTL
jgi:hypothetical protein